MTTRRLTRWWLVALGGLAFLATPAWADPTLPACPRTGGPVCYCQSSQPPGPGEDPGHHGLGPSDGLPPAGLSPASSAVPAGLGGVFQVDLLSGPNRFVPAEITIQVGDTVLWVWVAGNHSTTSYDGLWDSGVLPAGSQFSYTFTSPGDFAYFCIPHEAQGMVGVVHVVPEPSTLALIGIGTLGLLGYGWRRRKQARLPVDAA